MALESNQEHSMQLGNRYHLASYYRWSFSLRQLSLLLNNLHLYCC